MLAGERATLMLTGTACEKQGIDKIQNFYISITTRCDRADGRDCSVCKRAVKINSLASESNLFLQAVSHDYTRD
jgi:hypothetical protein